ncbi:MAG TPA: Asp-tRNA(Asn)/Glu-tRNA(Gln) amidotransferase subunit GatA [Oscillospiraceae bacterium]|nr:Asp-tRNA(Asn)/Glu-tRNA(Gln) amidotransferase subunit GatA [Oscillospiraceae bacterium]
MKLNKLTALELAKKIHSKEIKITQALDAMYAAIEGTSNSNNSFITLCKDEAYEAAKKVQALIDEGEVPSPLAGVPIVIKDNICTKGVKTTAGSKMLHNFVPPYDAFVVEKLKKAGMIIAGKTNMDEFAMGSASQSSYFGPVLSPLDKLRVPGGSSGGSAAAVKADEAYIALGSDTGGSIRQPAAFCGICGLRPSYGAVSRRGLIALASSMDTVGPMGKTVADCAALFEIISGKDAGDSTSLETEFDYKSALAQTIEGKKIGLPKEFYTDDLNGEIKEAFLKATNIFRSLGAQVVETSIAENEFASAVYSVIVSAEASSNLARYDGIRYGHSSSEAETLPELYVKSRTEGFGKSVKARILFGNYILSSENYDRYFLKAAKARTLITEAYEKAFEEFDLLLAPACSSTAYSVDENFINSFECKSTRAYTVPASLAGLPALSLPCAYDSEGLPIGMQLIGRRFDEAGLLAAGQAFEKALNLGHDTHMEGSAAN